MFTLTTKYVSQLHMSNTLDKLKNIEKQPFDKKIELLKIIKTESEINNYLLTHEFYNLTPGKKTNSFNELVKIIQDNLNKYTHKAGGFVLEDHEWGCHLADSSKYELLNNEAIFDNSILRKHRYDYELNKYLCQIIKIVSSMTTNYVVSYNFIDDVQGLTWVVIYLRKK